VQDSNSFSPAMKQKYKAKKKEGIVKKVVNKIKSKKNKKSKI